MNKSTEIYRKRINLVIDYVNQNIEKSLSLDELAAVAAFSPFHFHRIFVAVTGESVNAFTNRIRLEKAARHLKFSKQSIAEIAFECGFSSTSTLSRAFKQYFESSPSAYRKFGTIENSKIRKDLFPIEAYLVTEKEEAALSARFPVEIRTLPARRIAYIRVLDAYREGVALQAFEKLCQWANEMDLLGQQKVFGMSADDPRVTPKEKYRYEACITLPDDFKIPANAGVDTMILASAKYAIARVTGDFDLVAKAIHYLFNNWLINSPYEPAHQPGLEVFMDNQQVCNWAHFDLELCIPIKNINQF